MGNQNQIWGAQLKKFRMATGLSQAKFSDELSLRIANLNETQKAALEEIGLSYDYLDNTELSRYENGKRLPRYRRRYIFLIWGLVELGGLRSVNEANDWLFLVDQSPLTKAELEAVFANHEIEIDLEASSQGEKEEVSHYSLSNNFNLWAAGSFILLLVLVTGYMLRGQFFGDNQVVAITQSNNADLQAKSEPELVDPTATANPTPTKAPTEAPVPKTVPVIEPVSSDTSLVGDFSNWVSGASGDAEHTVEIRDGRLCSTVLQGSIYPWELKLFLEQVSLEQLTTYELSLRVESDTERNMTVALTTADTNNGYLFSTQPLIAGINEIKIPFIQTSADQTATLNLWIGRGAEGIICFEEIGLDAIDTVEAPAVGEPVSPASIIKKGDFSNGGLERPWWLFEEGIGAFRTYVDNDRLCSQVIQPPPNIWDLTIGQHEIMVDPDTKYRLTFDVETDREMDLLVLLKSNVHTHLDEIATISSGSSQSLSYEISPEIEDSASFSLRFGGQDGRICFDNIELLPVVEQ